MKRAISGKLAKKIDTYSIDNGMPSLVLMERAALKAVGHIEKIMQADGLCRYDDVDKCRRVYATTEICERCIHSWLLTKAKVELIREGKMKHEC